MSPPRVLLACVIALSALPNARGQDDAPPDSPYVRLLKSGKLPADRLGVAIKGIGQRGGVIDLDYLFRRVVMPDGFPEAIRFQVLDVLADAANQRKLKPAGDLGDVAKLLAEPAKPGEKTKLAALRLVGAWKVESAAAAVRAIVADPKAGTADRSAALDCLASLGGPENQAAIVAATDEADPVVAGRAVAALARLDAAAASERAAAMIVAAKPGQDLSPVLSAFVDLKGGPEILAAALDRKPPGADAAKLGLRALYAIGHADEALVASLSKAAGIEAESKPLEPAEMEKLVADVAKLGDPARGEAIFRRAELNCMKCHSIGSAGGGVGPDLSAVGVSSPVDYLVNSILLPDLAIKEVYETLMVLTDDGRVYQGIVVEKDDDKIVLKDATAEVRTIPAASVEESKVGGSLMPKGLANLLTRAEFVDLVRFLADLGKPGPYAVNATPTVHRWRVGDGDLHIPFNQGSATTITSTELGPENHTKPAYSRANGDLPLAEVVAEVKSPKVMVLAEITASSSGPVAIRLNSAEGITARLNGDGFDPARPDPVMLKVGKNELLLAVDTVARKADTLKVEVVKPPGSSAEFAIVGGK
ncbi:hypothetical protein TA3x_004834 [Tundrisphaera sp. TA3]|uniref:hypothetical protein n=1 Tax=Tundrisphaera sp. TA3 TaxID=3435775 RepID=UPI003EBCD506